MSFRVLVCGMIPCYLMYNFNLKWPIMNSAGINKGEYVSFDVIVPGSNPGEPTIEDDIKNASF